MLSLVVHEGIKGIALLQKKTYPTCKILNPGLTYSRTWLNAIYDLDLSQMT